MIIRENKKYISLSLIFVFFFTISFFGKSYLIKNFDVLITRRPLINQADNLKDEIILIYLGSSTCIYCLSPKLNSSLKNIDYELKKIADELGLGYKKIGLSKNVHAMNGIQHLYDLQIDFDEISTGNGWRNLGINYYTNIHQSINATPQIIITKRVYYDSRTIMNEALTFKEKIITRFVGLENINKFNVAKLNFD